jgi:hypothetical protein
MLTKILTNVLNNIKEPKYTLELINTRFNNGKLKLLNLSLEIINEDKYEDILFENETFKLYFDNQLKIINKIESLNKFYIKINNNSLKLFNILDIELLSFDLYNLNVNFDVNNCYIINNKYIINGSYIFELNN